MATGSDDALAAHELDLVTRAASGDVAAFERFFQRHGAHVQLLVERLLGPGETADRVTVEAFEKTVRRLPLLGARNSTPGVYLLTTARNGAYAELGRTRPEPADEALAALFSLPSRQRELLALREIGLDLEQAAAVAGVASDEVGPQVARARLRLVDALEGTALAAAVSDPADEALLGAVALRPPGVEDPELDARVQSRSEQDDAFAQAVAVTRSPARSTGRLPSTGDAGRLAAVAAANVVGEASAAASASTSPAATQPLSASGSSGETEAVTGQPEGAEPASGGDPFDDMIGDEAAWGIVDADGEAPTQLGASVPPASAPQPPGTDAALGGWDELDWPDEEAARATATGGDDEPADADDDAARDVQDETRAFDMIGAGLADVDAGDAESSEPRRSRWRFLVWLIALLLVFAGVAFAAYTIANAARDGDSVERTVEETRSEQPADEPDTTDAATEPAAERDADRRERSSSSDSTNDRSTSSGGSGGTSSSSSTTTSSTGGSGGSGGSSGTSRSATTSTGGSGGGTSGAAGNSGGSTEGSEDRTVSGGPTESGGSIRGESGTTP